MNRKGIKSEEERRFRIVPSIWPRPLLFVSLSLLDYSLPIPVYRHSFDLSVMVGLTVRFALAGLGYVPIL